jgi:hypothetical protein
MLVIDENNFDQYFKDVRNNSPSKGEVIAQYSAAAEFVDGNEKRQIIALVSSTENKMEATAQVMRKLLFASELDAYRIPRQIAEDLLSGLTEDEIASKPYKYTLEMFFYAQPENVPHDDPHWSVISVLNLDDFLAKKEGSITSRIVPEEEISEIHAAELGQSQTGRDAGISEIYEIEERVVLED